MIRTGDWTWSGNHYDPEMPLRSSCTFRLWNEATSLFSVPGVESFWERRTIRSLEDLSFPCLSPVDHLGYLALHILRNILLRDWVIHHVRELALLSSHPRRRRCLLDGLERDPRRFSAISRSHRLLLRSSLVQLQSPSSKSRMKSRISHLHNNNGYNDSPDQLLRLCFIRTRIRCGYT